MSHYTPTSPVVSALMVTHDAEKTVRRAVESLQNQTLRNFELVVVDAGSQDSTPRLLESAAERDMRIRVVQADACDRQTALNLALDRARGTYLAVTDADGWADQTMFADLVDAAERGRAELVIGGFVLSIGLSGGREARAEVSSEGVAYPTQHEFRAAAWKLLSSGQLLPAGGKLFSRAFAKRCGVRFLPSSGSDHSFVTGFLADVERVVVCPGTCCHMVRRAVRQGADGALEAHRHVEGEHGAILELFRHWGLEGDAASMAALQDRYIEQLVDCIERVCGRGSRVSSADQRRIVSQMIDTDRAQLAASVAHPRGNAARAMLAPIRSHNASLVCVQTRLMSLLRPGIADVAPDFFV